MGTVLTARRGTTTSAPTLRVLVVDECPFQRREVCQRLRDDLGAGVRIWETEESADALALLERQSMDVVFVEYPWPTCDGVDLLGEIRSACDDTVVVLLTGHGNPIVPAEALRRGADAYLSKSDLGCEPLPKLLGRLIASRRLRQDARHDPLDLRELAAHLRRLERCLEQTTRRTRRAGEGFHHSPPPTP